MTSGFALLWPVIDAVAADIKNAAMAPSIIDRIERFMGSWRVSDDWPVKAPA